LLGQKLLGRLDVKFTWPSEDPCMYGFMKKDPLGYLLSDANFFLLRRIETNIDKLLLSVNFLRDVSVFTFFFVPLLKTVIVPLLFLPALFLCKILKYFNVFANFKKKMLFLCLCVLVVGVKSFIKI
jgi:hypothetical protein